MNNNRDQSSQRHNLSPSNANESGEATNTTSDIASSVGAMSGRSQETNDKILKNEEDDLDNFFSSLE
jgi:hypothetical protein